MANPAKNRSISLDHREPELQVPVPLAWSMIITAILTCFLPYKTHEEQPPLQPTSPICLHLSHFDVALWLVLKKNTKLRACLIPNIMCTRHLPLLHTSRLKARLPRSGESQGGPWDSGRLQTRLLQHTQPSAHSLLRGRLASTLKDMVSLEACFKLISQPGSPLPVLIGKASRRCGTV